MEIYFKIPTIGPYDIHVACKYFLCILIEKKKSENAKKKMSGPSII